MNLTCRATSPWVLLALLVACGADRSGAATGSGEHDPWTPSGSSSNTATATGAGGEPSVGGGGPGGAGGALAQGGGGAGSTGQGAGDQGGGGAVATGAVTTGTGGSGGAEPPPFGEVVADFSLQDVNPASATFEDAVSPRDYLERVSGWYFGHAT